VYTTNISRISISISGKTARMRNLRGDGKSPSAFEMPTINRAYNGKKYEYAYMTRNFDRREQNTITKVKQFFNN
jgi:carotenoid cleavage dioxygenase-like enzyme